MSEYLGTRALARALGVVPSAVVRAVNEGRITPATIEDGRKLFDLATARREWLRNTAPRMQTRASILAASDDELDDDIIDTSDDDARYQKARADREEARAAQERITLDDMRRNLLPRAELEMMWKLIVAAFRNRFAGMSDAVLARYPGLTEAGRDFFEEEIQHSIDDLESWNVENMES